MLLQRIADGSSLPPGSGAKEGARLTRTWEVETFGMTADEAGARLLKLWEFPPITTEALRFAMTPESDPVKRPTAALLHLAGWVGDTLGKKLSVEAGQWTLRETVLALATLDRDRVQSAVPDTRAALNRTLSAIRPAPQDRAA